MKYQIAAESPELQKWFADYVTGDRQRYPDQDQLCAYFPVRVGKSWYVATIRNRTITLVDGPYAGAAQASGNKLIRGH